MSQDAIRYDLLVQEALRGVVRKVLSDTAQDGLPGDHHFYVSFRTKAPGVRLSNRLREQYPEEMTIVLQHQFWDLGVTEHAFEIGLSFDRIPERLLIPYDAITGFFDPSVQFGLKFEMMGEAPAADVAQDNTRDSANEPDAPASGAKSANAVATLASRPADTARLPATQKLPRGASSEPEVLPPAKSRGPSRKPAKTDTAAKDGAGAADTAKPDEAGAAVVSLDSFRKKK
jgi:hypothetical protein